MLLIVLAVAILVQVVTSGGAGAPPVGRPIAMTSAPSFPLGLVRILSCSELCGPFYFALVAAVLACGCETVTTVCTVLWFMWIMYLVPDKNVGLIVDSTCCSNVV